VVLLFPVRHFKSTRNHLRNIVVDSAATSRIGLNFRKMATTLNSAVICTYSSSRSSKVVDFGTNGKPAYYFLLVINSNYGPILYRFWDTATYCIGWKLCILLPLSYLAPLLPMYPLGFRSEVRHGKTRVMGLPCGESCMILASIVFDWSTRVTDVQTDVQTCDNIYAL